jgi:hypothetical protein
MLWSALEPIDSQRSQPEVRAQLGERVDRKWSSAPGAGLESVAGG